MKRIHYQIVLFLLIGMAFSACEKTVAVRDTADHQLVLNGMPKPDSRPFVYFAQTRFFLDSSNNQSVGDALLTLTVNGTPMTPDSDSRCRFFFPCTLVEGDSIAVDVVVADGREAHAKTYVPFYPDVHNARAAYYASPSFNFHLVSLRLDDRAGINEYYSVVVHERDSGQRHNDWHDSIELIDTVYTAFFVVPDNPEVTSNDVCPYIPLGGYLYSRLMFMDRNIDGRQYDLNLFIMQTVDTNEIAPFKHEYIVDISSVTPAWWNYQISTASQNSMFSLFAEQGEVWGNVHGALGVFAGSASRSYWFCPDTIGPAPVPIPQRQ